MLFPHHEHRVEAREPGLFDQPEGKRARLAEGGPPGKGFSRGQGSLDCQAEELRLCRGVWDGGWRG